MNHQVNKNHLFRKVWMRGKLMGSSGFYRLIGLVFNLLLSYITIDIYNESLWGDYVQMLLIIQLTSQFLSWGSGDFILRSFSQRPNKIVETWQKACTTRSVLLIPIILILTFTDFHFEEKLFLIAWAILDFIYGLFGALIIYYRKYKIGSIIELTGHIILILGILTSNNLDIQAFIQIILISLIVKLGIQLFNFRKIVFKRIYYQIDWKFLKLSFPFYIFGIISLLQSRVDHYLVAIYLPSSTLGQFHILMRWASLSHLGLTFILLPYIQNIYRLQQNAINKLILKLFLAGILVSILQVFIINFILAEFYQISFDYRIYTCLLVYLIPFYGYYLKIYEFFKKDKQVEMIIITLLTGLVNAVLSIFLVPRLTILGAILASAFAQLFLLFCYFLIGRYKNINKSISI